MSHYKQVTSKEIEFHRQKYFAKIRATKKRFKNSEISDKQRHDLNAKAKKVLDFQFYKNKTGYSFKLKFKNYLPRVTPPPKLIRIFDLSSIIFQRDNMTTLSKDTKVTETRTRTDS